MFTEEQNEKLVTWAQQRDALLLENSNLQIENEKLQSIGKELANSNTDIETRMNEIVGRIEELKIKEVELQPLISKDIASLKAEKAAIEAQIPLLEKILEDLALKKSSLQTDIGFALSTFEIIKDEALLLDKVVDRVTLVSAGNVEKIDLLVSNLATSLEEIIEVNRKNVFETNVVIEKLPKMIMEAQKHGLIKNKT